jgi:hypothetical protein
MGTPEILERNTSVMAGQGMESESRELMVGQGHELGCADLAGLDRDRGLS